MALRIRKDGRIFCAAMHPEQPGDAYLTDSEHYYLSVERRVLMTEPFKQHARRGEWWWRGQVPSGVVIDSFYLTRKNGDAL